MHFPLVLEPSFDFPETSGLIDSHALSCQLRKEGFEQRITGDGSPTLFYIRGEECMHNLKGALSESLYVYQSTMASYYEREAQRDETQGDKETQRDETQGDKETQRDEETQGDKETQRDEETQGDKETQRDEETQGDKETQRDDETQGDETQGDGGPETPLKKTPKETSPQNICIHRKAFTSAQKEKETPKYILSVGLGLGYNEMIVAAEAILGSWDSFYLESFENQGFLREILMDWIYGKKGIPELHERVSDLLSQHYQLESEEIRRFLLQALSEGKWKIREVLDLKTNFERRFNCIFFDAYSASTSPEMWTEKALESLLSRVAQPNCVFSTYAAKGNLVRSLKNQGFKVELRKGFGGKREYTWAERRGSKERGDPTLPLVE